jgi:integrase/recombinase XerD
MLTIYRRHRKDCSHRTEGRAYRRCQCPIWVDGMLGGQEVRKSLAMRDWQKAQDHVREWEARETEPRSASEPTTIQESKEKYLADANARCLNESTIYKYRLLFRQLEAFAEKRGLRYLQELDLETLDSFRAEWKDGPRSSLKKLERLRAFFRFCERRKWVDGNPAADLRAPKVQNRPTMPFTQPEMVKVLVAFDKYSKRAGVANAQRLRAFVLLLRYSGMRIGDAVACGVDRIDGDRLFLYTQKTGVPVHCVLPAFVIRELEAAPKSSEGYFFWTGKSKLHSAIGKWQRRLQNLFTLAEVKGGHAHRFRDTFAVELLLAGVPLERVSVLLSHQSIRITERHYSPWVRSRQDQLEQDLRRAWSEDPLALMQTKGTPRVHRDKREIN